MTRSADYVSLEVGGERLDTWTEYSVDSDLLQPADAFSLTVEVGAGPNRVAQDRFREYRAQLSPGSLVRLYVGDDVSGQRRDRYLQLSGRIDEIDISNDRHKGTVLRVTGRDHGAYLVDSTVPPGLLRAEGAGFVDLVEAAVEPWGLEVLTDGTGSRDIFTGRHMLTSTEQLQSEEARAQGLNPAAFSRALRRRAERSGTPLDEAAGVTADPRARRRTSNQLLGSDVRRLTQRQASPKAGESIWEYLSRLATRLGVMMWMDPRGRLVVSSPRYDQRPLYRLVRRFVSQGDDPNTILSGSRRIDDSNRLSEVVVQGRAGREGAVISSRFTDPGGRVTVPMAPTSSIEEDLYAEHIPAREAIRVVVADDRVPFLRRMLVHDASIRTEQEAMRRALREMHARLADSEVLDLELPNHGLGHYLFAVDTMAAVEDEILGVSAAWYVTKRTFMKSRDQGSMTRLRLVPSGALVL
jgi:prophage tail gpP-like protein